MLGLTTVLADAGFFMLDRPVSAAMAADTEQAVRTHPLAPRSSHFPARAKRVIFLFMNGGPSHVDTLTRNLPWAICRAVATSQARDWPAQGG